MKILWSALGTITGAMSVSSFISEHSWLSLEGIASKFVGFYQGLSSFVFGTIPAFFNIPVPQWLCDAWTLSFVLTAGTFRMIHYDYSSRGTLTFVGVANALFYCIPIVRRHPIKRMDPRTEQRVEAPCYRLAGVYFLKTDVYWYSTLLSIAGIVFLFFITSAYVS